MSFFSDHSITFSGSVKLADFGSGFVASEGGSGAVLWDAKAPERLEEKFWDLPADIWALACTILELVAGRHFFRDPSEVLRRNWTDEMFLAVVDEKLNDVAKEIETFLRDHMRDDMDTSESDMIAKLALGMLRRSPGDRMDIIQVQKMWETMYPQPC
ncbi:hypothetical protein ACEQ8H_007550 [Pleosporales sp. CAS-2024a]